jgi:hypothetical protein
VHPPAAAVGDPAELLDVHVHTAVAPGGGPCSTSMGVRRGIVCGLNERSCNPGSPCAAYRSSHFFTHLREVPIALAMWAWGQPAR